jgi:hypothetical protein
MLSLCFYIIKPLTQQIELSYTFPIPKSSPYASSRLQQEMGRGMILVKRTIFANHLPSLFIVLSSYGLTLGQKIRLTPRLKLRLKPDKRTGGQACQHGIAGRACPALDGSRLSEKIRKFNGSRHSRTKPSFSAG